MIQPMPLEDRAVRPGTAVAVGYCFAAPRATIAVPALSLDYSHNIASGIAKPRKNQVEMHKGGGKRDRV